MFVVIFRAKARILALDAEYAQTAARLRDLALREHGCLEFTSLTDGSEEIALSYWPDEESVRAWKRHADHVMAQRLGRERWYATYRVDVAEIRRSYRHPPE